tara:strand:+ start:193 stop:1071 length:879 start_codon:yes stop_codon:yes gene_type:complete
MKRKEFILKGLFTSLAATLLPSSAGASNIETSEATEASASNNLGYNHMPNKETTTFNSVLHKANTRGSADHGWLKANHTFSFANYRNPERMSFGVLRVLNDDSIAGGKGFPTHPHANMEIITIPLEGRIKHKDSMGNESVISSGDIQVMSAGSGVQHSEYNAEELADLKLLQIWLFANKQEVEPRYQQIPITSLKQKNEFHQVLSPSKDDQGVWIYQNAWFHMGTFELDKKLNYQIRSKENGLYAFMIDGEAEINGQQLEKRDGFGLWNLEEVSIAAKKGAKILLMEVPMKL